jgi:hypothetical protein
MHGRVLEVSAPDPEKAMRVLKVARQNRQIRLEEVALYGAQIHAVTADAQDCKATIRRLLANENIQVKSMEWITPTLEDVFISSIKASGTVN